MGVVIAVLLGLVGLVVPGRIVALGVPPLLVAAHAFGIPALVRAGALQLTVADPLLLGMLLRLLASLVLRPGLPLGRATSALGAYGLLLLPGIVVGLVSFGAVYATDRTATLARFLLEASVIPVLALSVRTPSHVRAIERMIMAVCVVAAFTVYVDRLAPFTGVAIGEVSLSPNGTYRAFGVVGDQVGFVLALPVFLATVRRRLWLAAYFLGAILFTAGLGAFATVFAGFGTMLALQVFGPSARYRAERTRLVVATALVVAVAGYMGVSTVRERMAAGLAGGSALQRVLTATVALDIVRQRPVTGVGYLGMLPASVHLGSVEYLRTALQRQDFAAVYVSNAGNQYIEALVDGGILGLAGLLVMLVTFARILRAASRHATPHVASFYLAAFLWITGLMIGNQSAVWLLPASLIASLVYVVVGSAAGLVGRARAFEPAPVADPGPARAERVDDSALPASPSATASPGRGGA